MLQTNNTTQQIDVIEEEHDDVDILSFIPLKYCTICHLEIPLRAKHCKSCDQCVATHDHHCPWIGSCVGERNRHKFYIYVCFQLLQTLLGAICCACVCDQLGIRFSSLDQELMIDGAYIIVLTIACVVISISLAILLGLHTYLAMHALTSWEFFSWQKITYLKVWPRKYGSPFG